MNGAITTWLRYVTGIISRASRTPGFMRLLRKAAEMRRQP